jgi:hypothetical protein
MTWIDATIEVDREITCLSRYYQDKIPTHPAPTVLALRVLLARERNRLRGAQANAQS